MTSPSPRRLALLVSFSGAGGVELMVSRLTKAFVEQGIEVDLLTVKQKGPYFDDARRGVNVLKLPFEQTYANLPALVRYLRTRQPHALLAAKDRAIRTAALAKRLADSDVRLVARLGTNLTAALDARNPLHRWIRVAPMRFFYRNVDRIVAVSEGVADDTRQVTRLDPSRILVVKNPAITPQLDERAAAPCPDAWLNEPHDARDPIIIAAGRLTVQKGFDILLKAFAALRKKRKARLIILGEGGQRPALDALITRLGIAEDVRMPGFQANPHAWLAKADQFVLSSRWEGSPNVLTEALALGIPSVSTDCPSGPREILADGRYGPLVPVDDSDALAAAMEAVLSAPLPAEMLRHAVRDYTVQKSAEHYLEVLGMAPDGDMNAAL